MLTRCAILTLASVLAVLAEETLGTLLITAWSHVARFTMTLANHRFTAAHTAPAVTLVGTVWPPSSSHTSFCAVGSHPAIFTNTDACHMMAFPTVLTGTAQQAAQAKVPIWTDVLTEISHESR